MTGFSLKKDMKSKVEAHFSSKKYTKNKAKKGKFVEVDSSYYNKDCSPAAQIENLLEITANFVKEKLNQSKTIKKSEFDLAAEIQYQIISIVKANSEAESSQLKGMNTFVSSVKVLNEMSRALIQGRIEQIKPLVAKLRFNEVLRLFRYLRSAFLKSSGKFFNYDISDIEANILSEFVDEGDKKFKIEAEVEVPVKEKPRKKGGTLGEVFKSKSFKSKKPTAIVNKSKGGLSKLLNQDGSKGKKQVFAPKRNVFDEKFRDEEFPEL